MGKLPEGQRSNSYDHDCRYIRDNLYRILWIVDIKYRRIRYPHQYSRLTDESGAKRFCKRWNIEMPMDKSESEPERKNDG